MEIPKLEYPEHLNKATLTEQELAALATPASQALARDWNIMNRKIEWTIIEVCSTRNIVADHDKALDTWKRVYWLICLVGASITGIIATFRLLGFMK